MPVYVVMASPQSDGEGLNDRIRSCFDENDRHEFRTGVWFVRSPLVTASQLRDELGIAVDEHSGVVVAAVPGRYTGVADGTLVEKLQVWEGS